MKETALLLSFLTGLPSLMIPGLTLDLYSVSWAKLLDYFPFTGERDSGISSAIFRASSSKKA